MKFTTSLWARVTQTCASKNRIILAQMDSSGFLVTDGLFL